MVGGAKNSGKTTALNHVLDLLYPGGGRAGIASIGIDGEEFDLWLGTPKPAVRVRPGFLVATAEGALMARGVEGRVVERTGIQGPMGEIVLFEARGEGNVLLAGLRHKKDLAAVLRSMEVRGAERVLVDGAYRRMIAADPDLADGAILATGAVLGGTPADVADATGWIVARLAAPPMEEARDRELLRVAVSKRRPAALDAAGRVVVPDRPGREALARALEEAWGRPAAGGAGGWAIAFPGAVTDSLVEVAMRAGARRLLARDPTRLCFSREVLARMRGGGVAIRVARAVRLLAVVVNPHSVLGADLPTKELVEAISRVLPEGIPVFAFEVACEVGGPGA